MADASESKDAPPVSALLGLPEDWPEQAADTVVRNVGKVRDVTTGPVIGVTRIVGYGILGLFPLLIVVTLGLIAAVRGLDILTQRTWAAHGILGLLFLTLGGYAWSKRPSAGSSSNGSAS